MRRGVSLVERKTGGGSMRRGLIAAGPVGGRGEDVLVLAAAARFDTPILDDVDAGSNLARFGLVGSGLVRHIDDLAAMAGWGRKEKGTALTALPGRSTGWKHEAGL